MKFSRSFIAVVCALLCSSCATSYVWRHTDPEEYVFIERTPANEASLRQHKVAYLTDAKRNVLYVEKTKLQKFHDGSLFSN